MTYQVREVGTSCVIIHICLWVCPNFGICPNDQATRYHELIGPVPKVLYEQLRFHFGVNQPHFVFPLPAV